MPFVAKAELKSSSIPSRRDSNSSQSSLECFPRSPNSNSKSDEEKVVVDPTKYKTKPCRNWQMTGTCSYEHTCCYAHGDEDRRSVRDNNRVLNSLGYQVKKNTPPQQKMLTHDPYNLPCFSENCHCPACVTPAQKYPFSRCTSVHSCNSPPPNEKKCASQASSIGSAEN
eukprot:NODE_4484_length_781_cov_6.784404_g4325_i0.p1 GENE.NODE_4484_length_781_cov_6.784404_g4325_i0~~NODE_4484_length_781_cov_6.784404_g4325_i0.p1  ORF type:complete len:169 (-),score=11.48 NODE_4484_length_781_cov_6.784404_g4325_i0:221-727(-)